MKDLELAKSLLKDEVTCVLVKKDSVFISKESGIKPIMTYLDEEVPLAGYSVADKIIGKAAAMMFVKAGIKDIYAEVLSTKGKAILEKYNIEHEYQVLTENIINRKGDDICPMEKTVIDIEDINDAYIALRKKVF